MTQPTPFPQLSPAAQERLIAISKAADQRSPHILARVVNPSPSGPHFGVTVLAGLGMFVGGLATLAIPTLDFGSDWKPWADTNLLMGHGVGIFVFVVSLLSMWRNLQVKKPPFREGVYLMPEVLVDAMRSDAIRLYPMTALKVEGERVATPRGARIVAGFRTPDGRKIVLDLGGDAEAQQKLATLAAARVAATSQEPLVAEAAAPPRAPIAAPAWSRLRAPIALGVALLSIPTWFVRNYLSEEAAWETLSAPMTDLEFERIRLERYAADPRASYAAEAQGLLLQADFDEAVRTRNLDAFLAENPDAPMRDEAITLRNEHAYAAVSSSRSVEELRGFVTRYPDIPQAQLALGRISTLYAEAQASTATGSDDAQRVLAALYAYLESAQEMNIDVVFAVPDIQGLSAADERNARRTRRAILRTTYSPMAPHFTPDACASRETPIVEEIARAINAHIPTTILRVRYGGQMAQADNSTSPVVHVKYHLRPTRALLSNYISSFSTFSVDFEIAIHVPGTETFRFDVHVDEPESISVNVRLGSSAGGGAVYGQMMFVALQQVGPALQRELFGS